MLRKLLAACVFLSSNLFAAQSSTPYLDLLLGQRNGVPVAQRAEMSVQIYHDTYKLTFSPGPFSQAFRREQQISRRDNSFGIYDIVAAEKRHYNGDPAFDWIHLGILWSNDYYYDKSGELQKTAWMALPDFYADYFSKTVKNRPKLREAYPSLEKTLLLILNDEDPNPLQDYEAFLNSPGLGLFSHKQLAEELLADLRGVEVERKKAPKRRVIVIEESEEEEAQAPEVEQEAEHEKNDIEGSGDPANPKKKAKVAKPKVVIKEKLIQKRVSKKFQRKRKSDKPKKTKLSQLSKEERNEVELLLGVSKLRYDQLSHAEREREAQEMDFLKHNPRDFERFFLMRKEALLKEYDLN